VDIYFPHLVTPLLLSVSLQNIRSEIANVAALASSLEPDTMIALRIKGRMPMPQRDNAFGVYKMNVRFVLLEWAGTGASCDGSEFVLAVEKEFGII